MNYLSVCSGIEAASVAWHPLGWKPVGFAEIEPFPAAVLAHHYPTVPNFGDMTQLHDLIEMGICDAPEILVGGTPCQAFSVAGLRKSLDDARGNLALVYCDLANAIDARRKGAGLPPAILVWENVPGVLSTKDNAFGCFLAGLAGEDEPLVPAGERWSNAGYVLGPQRAVAWRILDAQYFGLAQRRRRVFVVASARDGFDPATVLFEWEGVRRDSAPSREAGEGAAGGLGAGTEGGGVAGSLTARAGRNMGQANDDVDGNKLICMAHGQGGAEIGFDRGPTLTCNHEAPIAVYSAVGFNARQDPDHWHDRTGPLDTDGGTQAVSYAIQAGALRTNPASGPDGVGVQADHDYTLEARAEVQAVAVRDTALGPNVAIHSMQVRRLTPTECARLQGFPDNHLDILYRGKPAADGPKYKALGNSMAVPCMRWIGVRIDAHLRGELCSPEEAFL